MPAPRPRMPWDPLQLEPHEVSALKAITPAAMAVIQKITGVDRASFTAGGEDGRRATDFAEGARWVGLTLRQARDVELPVKPRGPEPEPPPTAQ